eukprot:jgi/Chrzof1/11033/Cz05g21050.t1
MVTVRMSGHVHVDAGVHATRRFHCRYTQQKSRRLGPAMKGPFCLNCCVACILLSLGVGYIQAAPTYKFVPKPGSQQAQALVAAKSTDDIIKRLYANSADLSVVTPQLVVTYLTKLQASAVGKQLRLNFTGAIQQAEDVVLLVKRDRKDGILQLFREYARKPAQLAKASASPSSTDGKQLQQSLQQSGLVEYMSARFGRISNTSPAADVATEAYNPPEPAMGQGSINVSSPPQTLAQMLQSIQHFNPKSGIKQPKTYRRLNEFKPVEIPIVFHCECGEHQECT